MNILHMSYEVATSVVTFIADVEWMLSQILMNYLHRLYEVSMRGKKFIAYVCKNVSPFPMDSLLMLHMLYEVCTTLFFTTG